jgi:hypothetical protein
MTQDRIPAYHFVGATLRNGDPVPPDGTWLEYIGPLPIIMCERGLHASEHPMDAIKHAQASTLCRVQLSGTVIRDTDKLVSTRRRILCRIDATDLLLAFARLCALDVAHLWECPIVVQQYLESGDESLRATARATAWAAAQAAARDAAWDAAWEKYRGWFKGMVDTALPVEQ